MEGFISFYSYWSGFNMTQNKISFILLFICIRKKTNEICDISYLLHNNASENKQFWFPTRSNTNWPLQ